MPEQNATAVEKGNAMTVIEEKPELQLRSGSRAELQVDREDISFHDLPGDRVRIQVVVRHAGSHPSRPTAMRLESAPLGAFVPWRPLAQLLVPALEPGESRELSAEAVRSRPTPLGDFDRVPPKRVLTALGAEDEPAPRSDNGPAGLLNLLGRARTPGRSGRDLSRNPVLAPDLNDLVNRGQPYWAGNINVFVGAQPVERHLARALRIYPGRNNLAMFVVGGFRRSDAYAFELAGLEPEWKAVLYNMSNRTSLIVNRGDTPIGEREWVESSGGRLIMLSVQPPIDCTAGKLEVHVTRRSTRKTAIVEFDLDPAAQGSGCYFA
jgi:hypothetical protein